MSENGNKMNKNKKIAIFVTAALVLTIPATIGIMCYYKLGPFGEKPSAASVVLNKAKNHESNVKPLPESNYDLRRVSRKNLHANDSIDSPQTQNGEGHESYATASAHQDGATNFDQNRANADIEAEWFAPLELKSFDFEVNEDIQNRKAFAAYYKYYKCSLKVLNGLTPEMREKLAINLETTDVVLTDTENVGIVHVIARYLISSPKTIVNYINKVIETNAKIDPLVKLVVELACHIKMRKEGGKVSLRNYNEYLHAIQGFDKLKIHVPGETLYKKALREAETFNSFCGKKKLFQLVPGTVEDAISKEFFDEIIPPSENTSE